MPAKKLEENLRFFQRIVLSPIDDPRQWVMECVHKERPELTCSEVVDQLMTHLNDFLSINEIYEDLSLGGSYDCDIVFKGEVSKWNFQYGEDNPYKAILSLRTAPVEGDGKWLPPQA